VQVHTLGHLEVQGEGDPIALSRRGKSRTSELLAVLVAHGGRDVEAARVADAMWPNLDADYAHRSLTTTLHRLREQLGEDGAILLTERREDGQRAVDRYPRGLEADRLAGGLYRQLMLCCQALGRRAEALEVYRRRRTALASALGVEPSAETTAVYERLLSGG